MDTIDYVVFSLFSTKQEYFTDNLDCNWLLKSIDPGTSVQRFLISCEPIIWNFEE